MKKVMIGILILIPVLILVVVAAVSSILKMAAWIAVDNISVVYKDNTTQEAESIEIEFSGTPIEYDFDDFVVVKVMPEYANRYTIEWSISDVQIMDDDYQSEYKKYEDELKAYDDYLNEIGYYDNQIKTLEADIASAKKQLDEDLANIPNYEVEKRAELQYAFDTLKAEKEGKINELKEKKKNLHEPDVRYVKNAAILVDDNKNEVTTNTSGKFLISSYCRFTVTVQVENVHATLNVLVTGYNVDSISVVNPNTPEGGNENESTLKVGEKVRVNANYTPVSSIVSKTRWHSDNESVAIVDGNGVITAVGVGSANITVEANRYDEDDVFVTSSVHKVEVVAGVSKFDSVFSTSKTAFTLDEIGVKLSDVLTVNGDNNGDGTTYDCTGCEIDGNLVRITDDVATINTKNGIITINKCGADDIIIENADIYDANAGYVFEVSGLTLKLRAVWADVLREGTPDGVVWEVLDDSKIVSVADNGEVKASDSGLVEIRAIRNGKTATLTLNVQFKLVAMSLRTGNAHFAVGLARETVFAAERYRFENSDSTDKDPNSVLIRIIDEPKAPNREDFENDGDYEKQLATYKKQLATFYNAYKYEIVSAGYYVYNENGQHLKEVNDDKKYRIEPVDGIYAYFSGDTSEPNRLIFIPEALEGQGKLTLRVKVSAKYPKYEGNDTYTSEEVDINVIYGVEVNNIAELRKASAEQKAYAFADGNLQEKTVGWTHTVTEGGKNDLYKYYDSEYSLTTFGISVMSDIRYEDETDDDGNVITVRDSNNIRIYGDVYGNNHWLTAERNQVHDVDAMLWIAWSNVTVSNFNIRANKMDKDGTLTTDETNGLQGECLQVFHETDCWKRRLSGVRIEYCILENARRAGQAYSADCTFDGVVIRNIDSVAFYVPARMNTYDDEGVTATFPAFERFTFNNSVFANCLSTIGSYSYERYSVVHEPSNGKNYVGRFVANDMAANEAYFMKYFYDEGINTSFTQTGFLDVYNWQNVSVANIIDTGDKDTNKLLGSLASGIFRSAKEFESLRYINADTNECFLHMGLLSTGISFTQKIMDEPSYLNATFEDERFGRPIRTMELAKGDALINAVRTMEIVFYGYDTSKKDLDLLIGKMFELNSEFFNRLHG